MLDSDIYDMYLYCYFGKYNLHGLYFGNMESDSGVGLKYLQSQ